ncbi:MAG: hypothetical protein ACPGJI_03230 [Kangiellaceae bacterium]
MSQKLDIDQIKEKLTNFGKLCQRKFGYLLKCINRFGISGVFWWIKTNAQHDDLNESIQDLLTSYEDPETPLNLVQQVLDNYKLPEEDLGHVMWYSDAHNKITLFQSTLEKKQKFDLSLLQSAMNELKYIGLANEFHQYYGLESLQQKVKSMYQDLQESINKHQAIDYQKLEAEKLQSEASLKQAETDKVKAKAKIKAMEAVKIKEKRIAIMENKKRKMAEIKLQELEIQKQSEQAEFAAKESEIKRQERLQESYRELEITEKIKEMPLEDLVSLLNTQVSKRKILTFTQLAQLDQLKQTIESKKA